MDFQMGGKGLGYADPLFPGTFCGGAGLNLVRKRGLEPLWIAPPDPKSGASANFATSAAFVFSYLRLGRSCFFRVAAAFVTASPSDASAYRSPVESARSPGGRRAPSFALYCA